MAIEQMIIQNDFYQNRKGNFLVNISFVFFLTIFLNRLNICINLNMEFCNSSMVHEPCVGNICRNTYKNAISDCEMVFEKNDCERWAIVWAIV